MNEMLSNRARAIQPSATLELAALTKKLRQEGNEIIGFSAGEPDFLPPDHVMEAVRTALTNGETRYTPAGGTPELKEAVRKRIKVEIGVDYEASEVVICCGAKHALHNLFQAILNPGDEVVIPAPYWLSYPEMVRVAEGEPVYVSSGPNGLPSEEDLEKAVTSKTRALILNSPSNPTGAVWPEALVRFATALAEKNNFWIVSDEIYSRLIYGQTKHHSPAALSPEARARTFLVTGVSKAYAMTGLRIGYVLGEKSVLKGIVALQSHSTSNPASLSQAAACAALEGPQASVEVMKKAFESRRDKALEYLKKAPRLSTPEARGAFYLFPNVKNYYGIAESGKRLASAADLAQAALEDAGVAVVPGASFGDPDSVRISYALGDKELETGMGRFVEFLNKVRID